jgi:hypothetical protein
MAPQFGATRAKCSSRVRMNLAAKCQKHSSSPPFSSYYIVAKETKVTAFAKIPVPLQLYYFSSCAF